MLEALGVSYTIQDDSIFIDGTGSVNGGKIATFNDHRIAMAGAIAAAISQKEITIENINCVEKSYPDFFKDLEKATVSF
jgi:3-phosphoshikimate 1-carboxyvinyltransferase